MWMYNIRPWEGSGIMLFLVVGRDKQEMLSAAVSYFLLSASALHLSAKNPVYTCWKCLEISKVNYSIKLSA